MLFAQTIAQFDTAIDEVKALIEELRQNLSHLEHEKQNLLATEQMWESAIAQIAAAKAATEAIGQVGLISQAKAAVDAVFSELPQLPEASEPSEPQPEPQPESPAPSPDDEPPTTIDVTPTVSPAVPSPAPESAAKPGIPTTAPNPTKPDYSRLDWAAIRRLAARHNVPTRRRTRQQIESDLRDKGVA